MKKTLLIALICAAGAQLGRADTLLSQNFNTFTDGNLVGQGGWAQISTTTTNPIQVLAGSVALGTSGQDAGVGFSGLVNSGTLTADFSLTLSAAGTGDYFLAFNTAASGQNFNSRVFAKSSGAGYLLGLQMGATAATPTYGTTELAFGTIYSVTLSRTFVAGALNDTGFLSVGGSAYTGTVAWSGTTAEDASLGALSLRQGSTSAGVSPSISAIDNIVVSGTPIPEPGTVALVGLGLAAVLFGVRRKRA